MSSLWTEERFEELKRLISLKLSAREISDRLGNGISRSAVIGKCYRENIHVGEQKLKRSIKRRKINRISKFVTAATIVTTNAPIKRINLSDMVLVNLFDLKSNDCRWPIDDEEGVIASRRFCGLQRMSDLTSYCAYHHSLTHVNNEKKDKNRIKMSFRKKFGLY